MLPLPLEQGGVLDERPHADRVVVVRVDRQDLVEQRQCSLKLAVLDGQLRVVDEPLDRRAGFLLPPRLAVGRLDVGLLDVAGGLLAG